MRASHGGVGIFADLHQKTTIRPGSPSQVNIVIPGSLFKKLDSLDPRHHQLPVFRIEWHPFSLSHSRQEGSEGSEGLNVAPRFLARQVSDQPNMVEMCSREIEMARHCRTNTHQKLSRKSFRLCTSRTIYLNPFRISTCKKTQRAERDTSALKAAANLPNLLESHFCRDAENNSHGMILLQKKPRGRGCLEV
jgi:hypothetical protein